MQVRPKLVFAAEYAAAKDQDYPLHQHSAWELIYYHAGQIECTVAGTCFQTRPGMMLLIPPKTPHADRARTAYRHHFLHLRGAAAERWPRVLQDTREGRFNYVLASCVSEWQGDAPHRAEMLGMLMRQLELLFDRVGSRGEPSRAEQLVYRAEFMLREQLGHAPIIKTLAAELEVSPSALRACFAGVRGYSPKAYLQEARLKQALALIRTSSLNLSEIAELCGFYSASHLSAQVKRATGRTPGSFRDSSRAAGDSAGLGR